MSFVSYLSNNKIWSNFQNPSYFSKLAFLSKSKTSLTEELSMISVKCSTVRHFCEVFVIALSSICRLFTFNWPIWVYYANISLIYNLNCFFTFFKKDIDECASTPCMYGNDCIQDRINSYICVCSERYEGVQCERGKTHYNNWLCLPSNPIW